MDDTPKHRRIRTSLQLIGSRLTRLHRVLIDEATATWAIATGAPPPAPLELFRLLRDDPAFQWLQPMTALIVAIGDLAAGAFADHEALLMADRVAALLDESDATFADTYRGLLQRDVDFAAAHAEVRGAIKEIRSTLAQ
jgi:hypothetical protein